MTIQDGLLLLLVGLSFVLLAGFLGLLLRQKFLTDAVAEKLAAQDELIRKLTKSLGTMDIMSALMGGMGASPDTKKSNPLAVVRPIKDTDKDPSN